MRRFPPPWTCGLPVGIREMLPAGGISLYLRPSESPIPPKSTMNPPSVDIFFRPDVVCWQHGLSPPSFCSHRLPRAPPSPLSAIPVRPRLCEGFCEKNPFPFQIYRFRTSRPAASSRYPSFWASKCHFFIMERELFLIVFFACVGRRQPNWPVPSRNIPETKWRGRSPAERAVCRNSQFASISETPGVLSHAGRGQRPVCGTPPVPPQTGSPSPRRSPDAPSPDRGYTGYIPAMEQLFSQIPCGLSHPPVSCLIHVIF